MRLACRDSPFSARQRDNHSAFSKREQKRLADLLEQILETLNPGLLRMQARRIQRKAEEQALGIGDDYETAETCSRPALGQVRAETRGRRPAAGLPRPLKRRPGLAVMEPNTNRRYGVQKVTAGAKLVHEERYLEGSDSAAEAGFLDLVKLGRSDHISVPPLPFPARVHIIHDDGKLNLLGT